SVRRIPVRVRIDRRPAGVADAWPELSHGCGLESDPALLTFTTGSTGQPKAAVRSGAFLMAQYRAISAALEPAAGDIDLTTLPMLALANLGWGVTSLIPDADLRRPGDVDPAPIARQIGRWRPNRTIASPALLDRLARFCLATRERLDSFDRVFTGGGPVAPRRIDRLRRGAPGARIAAVDGSTEAEPIAPLDWRRGAPADRQATPRRPGPPA